MNHNVNIFRATGELTTVQRFVFSEDDPCTLPDGSFILHSSTYEDGRGDYVELWVAVPERSTVVRRSVNILGKETPTASDPDDTLNEHDYEDDIDSDEPAFQL